ncbi:hypothetical protein RUM43_010370 [Polyplax serrata]|uniref:Uncharacterized protein n=1 Tax=Polyplax serrata TaxID=468196 RepID=A0AAN8PKS0_POLSC
MEATPEDEMEVLKKRRQRPLTYWEPESPGGPPGDPCGLLTVQRLLLKFNRSIDFDCGGEQVVGRV